MAITVAHTTTANALSVTIPSTTAGNCLVVCVSSEQSPPTAVQSVSGITLGGSAGNFAQLAGTSLSTNACAAIIWADPNCAGGQTAIVISGSNLSVGSSQGGVTVYEISGLAASSVLDQSSTSIGTSATYTSGTTPTTTQASEIVIGCTNFFGTLSTSPAGYTNSTFSFASTGYEIVAATGAYVYSGTQSASDKYAGAVVALKAAGAVAFDAVGPSSAGATSVSSTTLSWSHTNAGNALAVGVALGAATDTGFSLTATYAGTAMAGGAIVHSGGITAGYLQVFTLLNPAAGANTVAVTASGGTPGRLSGGSVSATGAGSFRAQYSNTAVTTTTATATSSGSTSGSLIAAFVTDGSGTTSATSPSTSRFILNGDTNTAAGNCAGATSPGTGSNVTTAWTISSDDCAVIAVEILPATAAAVIPLRPLPSQVTVMRASVY